MKKLFLTIIVAVLMPLSICAQTVRNSSFERYIEKYKTIAIEQMQTHGIPASITLAQGLLESGAGNSELAKQSNNHFGIKVGSDWNGDYVTHHDDYRDERFRKYATVRDSYEDHSQFLLKPRYQRLFRLSILDYKGWARGLKACGYATSPTYADRLIGIIELYNLNDLDEDPRFPKIDLREPVYEDNIHLTYYTVISNNNIPCVVSRKGDTWETLSTDLKVKISKLLTYNEAYKDIPIPEGTYIYLKKKASKGPASMKGQWHKIGEGESMYSISQKYGIQIAKLYKMNFKDEDYIPEVGDILRVR